MVGSVAAWARLAYILEITMGLMELLNDAIEWGTEILYGTPEFVEEVVDETLETYEDVIEWLED